MFAAPTTVTVTEDGSPVQVTAIAGQVQVFFDPSTSEASAISKLGALGAAVVAKMPSTGYYLVSVTAGTENAFITSITADPSVIDAVAHGVSEGGAAVDITKNPISSPLALTPGVSSTVVDCFATTSDHGHTVSQVDKDGGGTVGLQIDVSGGSTNCSGIAFHNVAKAIALTSIGSALNDPTAPILINLSLGGGPQKQDSTIGCPSVGACPANIQNHKNWENALRMLLVFVSGLPEQARKNLILTTLMGNGSMDVSAQLDRIRRNPKLADVLRKNVILVGAAADRVPVTASRPLGTYSNSGAEGDADIVTFTGLIKNSIGATTDFGTSYASPRVEAIAEQLIKQVPGLTAEQIIQAIKKADEVSGLSLTSAVNEAKNIKALTATGAAIRVSGTVTNSKTGASIDGAKLVLVSTSGTALAFSSSAANGAYVLQVPVALRDQTTSVILQASRGGFASKGQPVALPTGSTLTVTANVTLDPLDTTVISVDSALHHLGDSNFSTPLNAGLQLLTAEGVTLTKTFNVSTAQIAPNFTKATLLYTVNGAECADPVRLNGTQIASLNNTIAAAQAFQASFNIGLLRSGSNTLTVSSTNVGCGGFDDFEVANISIKLSN